MEEVQPCMADRSDRAGGVWYTRQCYRLGVYSNALLDRSVLQPSPTFHNSLQNPGLLFCQKSKSHIWLAQQFLLPLVYNAMDLYMNCDLNLGEKCMVEGLSGMDGFSMCYCMPWYLFFFMIIPLFYFSCRFSAIKSRLLLHTGLPVWTFSSELCSQWLSL